jgi:hypothetical protein
MRLIRLYAARACFRVSTWFAAGLIDLLAEMGFRGLLHLLQDQGRDLRWRIGLAGEEIRQASIIQAGNIQAKILQVLGNGSAASEQQGPLGEILSGPSHGIRLSTQRGLVHNTRHFLAI